VPESTDIDPRTPVIVGVGQFAERIEAAHYRGCSPIELAATAAMSAIDDCGAEQARVIAVIDTVAATRQFENSSPYARAPLGRSTKFPLSVANRIGARPLRAVLDVSGGQSPQHLVTEFSRAIFDGTCDVVLVVGAEAISTIRHLSNAQPSPDFSDDPEDPAGVFEDRGFGLEGMVSDEQTAHGLTSAPAQYALLENARRAAIGMSRRDYAASMGRLFAPFTDIAAKNPYSASPHRRSAEDLVTVTERNRMIADPYPRFVVARDQVNQAAAALIMSMGTARRLGIDEAKWVFLHGQADLRERDLLDRASLGEAPAAPAAVRHALDVARLDADAIDYFDFYSCFPIAVSNIIDGLDISPDDPRGFTLTGGLPFFGGAGNNYSMHAIAEAIGRVRARAHTYALVSANGGILSKTSVGIYSATPSPWRPDQSDRMQEALDATDAPARVAHPNGLATIEAYTVKHGHTTKTGVVVGRLVDGGGRFVAKLEDRDHAALDLLENAEQPVGHRVHVTSSSVGNRVSMSDS
jgi:acetyl-CoA C-acetyltransferase